MNPPEGDQPFNENIVIGNGNRPAGVMAFALIDLPLGCLRPKPDVQGMFRQFNNRYFQGQLGAVKLEWTETLLPNAAACFFGKNKCTIKLSCPLMRLRTRQDLVDTLLHQMVHAYIFVRTRDKSLKHTPQFCKLVHHINAHAGCNMTGIYDMKCVSDVYNRHWWQCDGPCNKIPKVYGYVQRKHNVAPGPLDSWWRRHHARCGGRYRKVQEPTAGNKQTCTVIRPTPPQNERANNREVNDMNPPPAIPITVQPNVNLVELVDHRPPVNNAPVFKREEGEQNKQQNEQQNATVAGTSDNKERDDEKNKKQKHSSLSKKHHSKRHHASVTKKNKRRHLTAASSHKKAQKCTFVVKKKKSNSQQATIVKKEKDEQTPTSATVEENLRAEGQQAQATMSVSSYKINSSATNSIPANSCTQTEGNGTTMQLENRNYLPSVSSGRNMQKISLDNNSKYLIASNACGVSDKINIQNDQENIANMYKAVEMSPTSTETTKTANYISIVGTSTKNETVTSVQNEYKALIKRKSSQPLLKKVEIACNPINNFNTDIVCIEDEGIAANKNTIESLDVTSDTEEMKEPPLKKIKMKPQNLSNNCNEENDVLCFVKCPSCSSEVKESDINSHLDGCLEGNIISSEEVIMVYKMSYL